MRVIFEKLLSQVKVYRKTVLLFPLACLLASSCLSFPCASSRHLSPHVLDAPSYLGRSVDELEKELGHIPFAYPDIPTIRMRLFKRGSIHVQLDCDDNDRVVRIFVSAAGDREPTCQELCAAANIDLRDSRYSVGFLESFRGPANISVEVHFVDAKEE